MAAESGEFVEMLPWRLASLAGLVVGATSFIMGHVDTWAGLERTGLAFAAFFAIGCIARAFLVVSASNSGHNATGDKSRAKDELQNEKGNSGSASNANPFDSGTGAGSTNS